MLLLEGDLASGWVVDEDVAERDPEQKLLGLDACWPLSLLLRLKRMMLLLPRRRRIRLLNKVLESKRFDSSGSQTKTIVTT